MTALPAAQAPTPAGAQREWSPRRTERARASTPERQMSSGSAWPSNEGPDAPLLTGVSDGAASIGSFFPRLNHVTRNPAYLGKARRAADHIASTQHPPDAASEPMQSLEFAAPFAS